MNFAAASALADRVTAEIIADPELLSALMQASGIGPDDLRRMIDSPGIHSFMMPFAAEDDARIIALAGRIGARPQELAQAAALLAGPGHYGWSAD